jgi:hypothetical protein
MSMANHHNWKTHCFVFYNKSLWENKLFIVLQSRTYHLVITITPALPGSPCSRLLAYLYNMPTKSYRFYDPVHQTSFQHTLQTSDSAKTEDGHHRWSQSIMRQDFEDAQRGQDMRHIVPQASWIQYDLSKAKPIRPLGEACPVLYARHPLMKSPGTEPIVFTQPINLYLLSGDKTWIHCGAAILTFNDGTSRASKQAWVMLHSHGTHRHVGSFSIFHGMEVIRFNDSVLVTTVQVTPESPAARFVSYAFQVGEVIAGAPKSIKMVYSNSFTLSRPKRLIKPVNYGKPWRQPPVTPYLQVRAQVNVGTLSTPEKQ